MQETLAKQLQRARSDLAQARRFANLQLNVPKCQVIPLEDKWSPELRHETRRWLAVQIPEWRAFEVAPYGTYLGIVLGPSASAQKQWEKPVQKLKLRADEVRAPSLPAAALVAAWESRVLSVLPYWGQVHGAPAGLSVRHEMTLLNRALHALAQTFSLALLAGLKQWFRTPRLVAFVLGGRRALRLLHSASRQ